MVFEESRGTCLDIRQRDSPDSSFLTGKYELGFGYIYNNFWGELINY